MVISTYLECNTVIVNINLLYFGEICRDKSTKINVTFQDLHKFYFFKENFIFKEVMISTGYS